MVRELIRNQSLVRPVAGSSPVPSAFKLSLEDSCRSPTQRWTSVFFFWRPIAVFWRPIAAYLRSIAALEHPEVL